MSHPVADYLHELYLISGVSVPETNGYPAVSKLLNAVGESFKPKVTAVIHPSNNGASIPDGGLFSAKELKKHGVDSPGLFQLKPERGVIKVKALDWTEYCLAQVDRTSFVARYDMYDALHCFYEIFLPEFDLRLRNDVGGWYTPPEIVSHKSMQEATHNWTNLTICLTINGL